MSRFSLYCATLLLLAYSCSYKNPTASGSGLHHSNVSDVQSAIDCNQLITDSTISICQKLNRFESDSKRSSICMLALRDYMLDEWHQESIATVGTFGVVYTDSLCIKDIEHWLIELNCTH
jgi:hypothetical protein